MNSLLKHIVHFSIGIIVSLLMSCTDQRDYLQEARNQINNTDYLYYEATSFIPVPDTKLVDTSIVKMEVDYTAKNNLGYTYIEQKGMKDFVYEGGRLISVDHSNKLNRVYKPEHFKDLDQFYSSVDANFKSRWSPIVFLQNDYSFIKDTIINNSPAKDYVEVLLDSIIDNKRILTEHHVFINKDAEVCTFERRNYNDGKISQRITINFSDYRFQKNDQDMAYALAEDYVTAYGLPAKVESKKVGDKAPEFSRVTMAGETINLSDFKGRKVLLNFSVINCGFCNAALDYVNNPDYELSEDIPVIYINPEDDKERMKIYREDTQIPFPVIADAKSVGEAYGINSYPRFVLVDEEGVIEHVEHGFSEVFLDEYKKPSL